MRQLFLCIFFVAWMAADNAKAACTNVKPYEVRQVTVKNLVPQILCDQKQIWLYPISSAFQKYPVASSSFISGTVGLVALDPYTAPAFRNTKVFNGFNQVFSGQNTAHAMEIFPAAFLGASLLRHDTFGSQTALLAGEAVLDSELLTNTMKGIDQRIRPITVADGNYRDTWFKDTRSRWGGHGSFPSGHTIAAMSMATVFAHRYGPKHKWVPYVAYTAAGLIGFSRLTLSAHFLSDVAAGAVLGFSISHFVVMRGCCGSRPGSEAAAPDSATN